MEREIRFEIDGFDPNELGRKLHMLPCPNRKCARAGGRLNYSYQVKEKKIVGRVACWKCGKVVPLETSKLVIVSERV